MYIQALTFLFPPPLMPEIYPHLLPEEYELDFELVWLGASQQVAGETP